MLKWIIGVLVLVGLIIGGSWVIINRVIDADVKNAEAYCAQYNATPRYTYSTRYLCVTSDGHIVG